MLTAALIMIKSQLWAPRAQPAGRSVSLPKESLSLEGAAVRGVPTAKVGMLMFSDFECPFCARFARETLPALEKTFVATGDVQIAFRHLPLQRHSLARKAAEAAQCAGRQGKFWELHDYMFVERDHLKPEAFLDAARTLGLRRETFEACLAGQATAEVERDMAEAAKLGITGTPSFVIGVIDSDKRLLAKKMIGGAAGIDKFAEAIEFARTHR